MSWRVLLFAVLLTVLCLVVVGLFPALRLSRVDLNELLKSGAGTGSSRTMRRHYGALIVFEVALALALLSSASLLAFMAWEIRSVAAEHDAEGVLSTVVGVVPEGPRDRRTRRDWSERITQLALANPATTHAAIIANNGYIGNW